MPKKGDMSDWGPATPAGLPHGTTFIRGANEAHRRLKRKSRGKPPEDNKPLDETRPLLLADPNKKYLVGGSLVNGSVFSEGQLPANARPASPAPWRHTIDPSVRMERFTRRVKHGGSQTKEREF